MAKKYSVGGQFSNLSAAATASAITPTEKELTFFYFFPAIEFV
jgi:hypothetical protein